MPGCVSLSFDRSKKILDKKQFQKIYKEGKKYYGAHITVFYHSYSKTSSALGITIGRKWGKAFMRNRFKRVVREAFRLIYSQLPSQLMLNVHPKEGYQSCSVEEIQGELKQLSAFIEKSKSQSKKSCSYN